MIDGGFAYGYLFMSQHPETPKIMLQFLEQIRPSRILEIGTMHGGLTLCLRDILDNIELKENPIRTYDINDQEFLRPLVKERLVDIYTKNLFNDNYNDFANSSCRQEVIDFIQQDGITIVMCDGGCKKCEYRLLAPLLKSDDIIMAHDYAPNKEYFNQNMVDKIWNWMEINDSDILEVSRTYNLEPLYQDILLNIAWNCRKKNKH